MIDLLQKILEDKENRVIHINTFQKIVWDSNSISGLLSELAYDLDFYEPDIQLRNEDSVYYGDEKLKNEINEVIRKLQSNDFDISLKKDLE